MSLSGWGGWLSGRKLETWIGNTDEQSRKWKLRLRGMEHLLMTSYGILYPLEWTCVYTCQFVIHIKRKRTCNWLAILMRTHQSRVSLHKTETWTNCPVKQFLPHTKIRCFIKNSKNAYFFWRNSGNPQSFLLLSLNYTLPNLSWE